MAHREQDDQVVRESFLGKYSDAYFQAGMQKAGQVESPTDGLDPVQEAYQEFNELNGTELAPPPVVLVADKTVIAQSDPPHRPPTRDNQPSFLPSERSKHYIRKVTIAGLIAAGGLYIVPSLNNGNEKTEPHGQVERYNTANTCEYVVPKDFTRAKIEAFFQKRASDIVTESSVKGVDEKHLHVDFQVKYQNGKKVVPCDSLKISKQ